VVFKSLAPVFTKYPDAWLPSNKYLEEL